MARTPSKSPSHSPSRKRVRSEEDNDTPSDNEQHQQSIKRSVKAKIVDDNAGEEEDEQALGIPANRIERKPVDMDEKDVDDKDDEEDSEEDVGPMPPPPPGVTASSISNTTNNNNNNSNKQKRAMKRHRQSLVHEKLYLDNLPCTDLYERSLMHRDIVNFTTVVGPPSDFIITTSIDGHVKFWKKTERGVEFAKHFRAHLGAIVAVATSFDGLYFATVSVDKTLKVFDIVNFDMINMIHLGFLPRDVCWMYKKGQAELLLAVSDKDSNQIFVYDGKGNNEMSSSTSSSNNASSSSVGYGNMVTTPLYVINSVHSKPVILMRYNPVVHVVVSVDDSGMMEYWTPDKDVEFQQPGLDKISWEFKSDTDLYEFKKAKTKPTSLNFSPDYSQFVTYGFGDRLLRIFNFRTGKLIRKYDESLTVISEMQQAGTSVHHVDDMEFGRRLAIDREIEKLQGAGQSSTMNAIFDESGHFVLYPTLLGIKVVNVQSNKVVRLIGKNENQRFLHLALYQGAPVKKQVLSLEMAASDNPTLKETENKDPTLFVTAYKKNRFYLFTRRDPESDEQAVAAGGSGRDIFNEKPSREEQTLAQMSTSSLKQTLGSSAIIHTTLGDIHLRLFPEHTPKTVENFVGLAKKGYYDHVIFHRIIKGFMLQTGDPLGDGTGGESLWGHEFEDEFHKTLKHDRPYTLSMANCGPNTNGSQFFVTTVPCPWLDNKHTVFGRATGGFDVIHAIEQARTDKNDRPYQDIKILGIEIR